MSRTSQKGSIVSFVVVGVLLTAAVLGGLYVVNERNFFGLGDEATEVAQTGEDTASDVIDDIEDVTEPTDDVVVDTDEPAVAGDEGDDDVSVSSDEAVDENITTVVESEQTTAEDSTVADEEADEVEEMAVTGVGGQPSDGAQQLPVTGPSDTILAMLGVSSLVAAVFMYRRSTEL